MYFFLSLRRGEWAYNSHRGNDSSVGSSPDGFRTRQFLIIGTQFPIFEETVCDNFSLIYIGITDNSKTQGSAVFGGLLFKHGGMMTTIINNFEIRKPPLIRAKAGDSSKESGKLDHSTV